MASCEKALLSLVKQIEPTGTQKEGASRSHNFLRDALNRGNMANRVVDSYLSGSYARDTAIRPLDDVDIIFVIDQRLWPRGLLESLVSDYPAPETVLKTFQNAIRYRYSDSSLRLQKKSVRLTLYHLNIDVVPAIVRTDGETILIPDRSRDDWIVTAPKKHTEIASAMNQQRGGRFKPLVKLLKFWNVNLPSTARLKSFAIETMACRIFKNVSFASIEEGLLLFFDFVVHLKGESSAYSWNSQYGISFDWFECKVPDLANTGSNVTASVSGERKGRFMENAVVSRNRMLEAKNSRSEEVAWNRAAQALRC